MADDIDDIKQNITEHSTWVRVIYMLVFFVIYSVAEFVLFAVVIFQFLSRLLTAKLNKKLLKFGAELSLFAYEILLFLTYNSESKPFPFSEWPTKAGATNIKPAKKKPASKAASKKSKITSIKKEAPDDDDGQNSGI